MIDRELLKKVNRIHIQTSRVVNDIMAGEYKSVFKGRGMEFSEVRQYFPGDDIRKIDWNVTARAGEPFVKRFEEERELTVMLLVDMSASGTFGTGERTRNELSAEICALLAFSAIRNNDRVGLIIFTDRIEMVIPPKKGKKHVLRLIREVLAFRPQGCGTDISAALEYLNLVCRRHSVTFLISDFIDSGFERAIRITSKRHDLIPVRIIDPREKEMPRIGILSLQDAETGECIAINTNDRNTQRAYTMLFQKYDTSVRDLFRSLDILEVMVWTNKSYVDPLVRFFKQRESRIRR